MAYAYGYNGRILRKSISLSLADRALSPHLNTAATS